MFEIKCKFWKKCDILKWLNIYFDIQKLTGFALRTGRRQQPEQRASAAPASGKDGYYAVVDDWRGKMAAPEEPELSQAQTEKLLQFQVDTPSFNRTPVHLKPHVSVVYLRRGLAQTGSICCFKNSFFPQLTSGTTPQPSTWVIAGVSIG